MATHGVSQNQQERPIILLIEDEKADVLLFRSALADLKFNGVVHVTGSVPEARDYLNGVAPFDDRWQYPLPDLIVSDMNLPGANGYVFLEWLRGQERFCDLPFLFFSGSFAPVDKGRANELGVLLFAKTTDTDLMCQRVQSMLKLLPPTLTPPDST